MEYQARLIDNKRLYELPIEDKNCEHAILRAHRIRMYLQDKGNEVSLLNVFEVVRHSDGMVEHQPIWQAPAIFFLPKRKATV